MKVGGPGRTGATTGSKAGRAGSKSGTKFTLENDAVEAAAAGGVASSSPISSIEALVALQGIDADEPRRGNRAAAEKGEELLEKLEAIRHGLLAGTLSVDSLQSLQNTLSGYKVEAEDPRLREVIRDIEVRAAVELAKFGY
ncbi:flagellar assembly protein FliX [Sneathiella sp.]|uniref:flagellar assembly protein FliX n=1 Tax=Sneathiella sp. TaxID=1964365 RepID=UPI002FE2FEDB